MAKAERPEFSLVLESMAEAICALPEEPSPSSSSPVAGVDPLRSPVLQPGVRADTVNPDVEAHCEETPVDSPLATSESKESKIQNSRGAGHPLATKSRSWTTPESHTSSGHPEVSRAKGE